MAKKSHKQYEKIGGGGGLTWKYGILSQSPLI